MIGTQQRTRVVLLEPRIPRGKEKAERYILILARLSSKRATSISLVSRSVQQFVEDCVRPSFEKKNQIAKVRLAENGAG
jgi:hypothetical protein